MQLWTNFDFISRPLLTVDARVNSSAAIINVAWRNYTTATFSGNCSKMTDWARGVFWALAGSPGQILTKRDFLGLFFDKL